MQFQVGKKRKAKTYKPYQTDNKTEEEQDSGIKHRPPVSWRQNLMDVFNSCGAVWEEQKRKDDELVQQYTDTHGAEQGVTISQRPYNAISERWRYL